MTNGDPADGAGADASLIPGDDGPIGSGVYAGIQCLRFVAALMVVGRHATFYTN